jgi:ABC-type uncharacterized transport system permease subunit
LSVAKTLVGRRRVNLEIREPMGLLAKSLVLLVSVLIGLAVSVCILIASGVSASDLWNEFIVYIVTSPKNLSAVLVQSVPLMIAGLAAAVAFRARFWNIGIEGQMIFGAIAATYIAINDLGPEPLRLVLMFMAAAIGGIGWILLPAILKIKLNINEIISTLLMNYVAFNFLLHLLYGSWRDPLSGFPNSQQYDASEVFPLVGWQSLNFSMVISLFLVLFVLWLFIFSRFGFVLRVLHGNSEMARSLGIRIGLVVLLVTALSGALSGICGFVISAGIESRMTQSFFVGFGFSGILIAFLARDNPIGILIVSVLFATLVIGGQSLQVFYQIPFAMVQLIQAIIVMCVAGSEFFIRYRIAILR